MSESVLNVVFTDGEGWAVRRNYLAYSSDENEFLDSLAVWIFCGLFKKLTFNLSPLESVYFLFFKSSNFIKDLLS
jgi:hypothetical protein